VCCFDDPKYYTRYGTPQVQQLCKEADTGTPAQQISDLQQVAEILSKDAAADWLFLLPNVTITDKNITGMPANGVSEAVDLTASPAHNRSGWSGHLQRRCPRLAQ